jgi:uncharacterized membrane protein
MIVKAAGWVAIVLSTVILLVFAAIRLNDMAGNPPGTDGFGIRYVQHPTSAIIHILPGLVFLTLAPLQFVTRIRQRHLRVHRRLGWVLATCAAVSGVFALFVNFQFPAFGGIATQSATVFFGAIFLFSLVKAIRHIRRREIRQHREWMIRVMALAMGVATIRVFVAILSVGAGYGFEEVFGTAFWLGLGVNLLIAEIWINYTRVSVVVPRTPVVSSPRT